jgi:type II secretory pathway pseudopilin PulG
MRSHPLRRRRDGFTIVEAVVVCATLVVVLGAALVLLEGTRHTSQRAQTESRLQESGRRILADVLADLKRSGMSTLDGHSYPAIWERARGPESTPRGNLIATLSYSDESLVDEIYAWQGDGVDRITRNEPRVSDEVVFQRPVDLDGDGTPLDAVGSLEWTGDLISYRVIDDGAGNASLWRLVENGGVVVARDRVGPGVVKITVDAVMNDRTLRFSEVAVVLWIETRDAENRAARTAVEGSVVIRNTREL